ncbi:single-stranded DNA-binding protein [Allohahella marinimesophila]|uniref:Single-stranded DNA-binding protein n=1 Tax=Allohahella marinimesophila TaxID=1054972 RepID=A0ABP7Q7A7_9GAMM
MFRYGNKLELFGRLNNQPKLSDRNGTPIIELSIITVERRKTSAGLQHVEEVTRVRAHGHKAEELAKDELREGDFIHVYGPKLTKALEGQDIEAAKPYMRLEGYTLLVGPRD